MSAASYRPIVTGQSVLAIQYKDGIMMASDTQLCYGSQKRFKNVPRLYSVCDSTVLLGFSGEYSDFQYILKLIQSLEAESFVWNNSPPLNASQIAGYLSRIFYNRRIRLSPLWNQLLIAGTSDDKQPFLCYIDSHGTIFKDTTIATGMGCYLALPLLREKKTSTLSEGDAKSLLESCLRILSQRDCRGHTMIQIATVTPTKANVEEPFTLQQNWSHTKFLEPTTTVNLSNASW